MMKLHEDVVSNEDNHLSNSKQRATKFKAYIRSKTRPNSVAYTVNTFFEPPRMVLHVDDDNDAAIGLYKHLGYVAESARALAVAIQVSRYKTSGSHGFLCSAGGISKSMDAHSSI